MKDSRGLEQPERPDSTIGGLLWDADRRHVAAKTHATFEGHDIDVRAVSEGYDKNLHPWMHGRRYADLVEWVRERLSF